MRGLRNGHSQRLGTLTRTLSHSGRGEMKDWQGFSEDNTPEDARGGALEVRPPRGEELRE